MDILNNRYRVLKNIKQNRIISSYLVSDVKRDFQAVQLNIINSEYLPDNLLSFYTKEFVSITTIEHDNIVKLYDFGIIQSIDNKKMDNPQYFYVNENFEANNNFMQLVKNMDEDKMLDLFVQICQTINYLHLRGFTYGTLNIDNIYIDGLSIKLKDLATIELEKHDYWNAKDNQLVFKAPEILAEEQSTPASDIYSLGVLLFFILKREVDRTTNLSKQVMKLKNLKEGYFHKAVPILQKMLEGNLNERYSSVEQIIRDINRIYSKDYRPHKQEQIEKLNFKTKLVGRDYEINNVINIYNSILKLDCQKKFVMVHGEYGIGKTKLLKELEHQFVMKNVTVYSSFNMEGTGSPENNFFYEIFRKLIGECEADVLERYESELVKIIPELANKKNIIPVEVLPESKEKIRVLSAICNFINDFLKGKSAVFILDNLHTASDFSYDILEYLYLRSKNIMFIFSYCDGEFTYNKRLIEFVSKILDKSNGVDMQIHGLNKEDTILMIQDILRTPSLPASFGGRVFSKTYGNPLFVEETIKNLFAERILFVDENTGKWGSKYEYDYNKLPIPTSMEQAVLAQVKGIDSIGQQVLNILSIFNTGVHIETIAAILDAEEDNIRESIEDLENRGILCKKIEDRGFVHDFSNRILKILIMKKLDEEYSKTMHEIAASILEKQYTEGSESKEELIYHLEKSGQKEKVIKYCLENVDKMEAYKNRTEAIKNLMKAISMMGDRDDSLRKLELLIRVGGIFIESGNGSKAVEYYSQAEELAVRLGNNKYQIKALNKIAKVYFNKNDIEKTLFYITKAEKLLYKADLLEKYTEGYLECKEIQARIFYLKQKYEKVKELCERGIYLCGEEYDKIKGHFYKNLGNAYLQTGDIEKALECYEQSKVCFENIDYPEGIVIALNNIAVVWGDFYQDNETNINYLLRMKDISEKNHIITHEIMALTNLGCAYYNDCNYELAFQYFTEAVEKGKAIEFEGNVFYCYNYLTSINLKLGNYSQAYEYHMSATKELEEYPEHGVDIGAYYQFSAELFYTFGDFERAEDFIQKALDIYKDNEFIPKWDSEILYEYIIMRKNNSETQVLESAARIRTIIVNFKSQLKILEVLCDTAIVLYQYSFIHSACEVLEDIKAIKVSSRPSKIEEKILFLKGALGNNGNTSKLLNSALEIAKRKRDKELHYKICCALGDCYLYKKDYFFAVNYYFEASEIIKNLSLQLPEELRITFINSPGTLKPFLMLMGMRKSDNYSNYFINEESKLIIKDTDALKTLFDYGEFEDILTNKHFIKSAKKIYNSYLPKGIRGVKDIVSNLYAEPLKNLDIIAKYLASVTLATKSLIIVDGYDQNYYTIASNDGSSQVPASKYIFERVRATREPVLITESSINENNSEFSHMLLGVKAVICIPIIMNIDDSVYFIKDNKRKSTFINNSIKGYLYLEAERTLNNFNKDGLKKCLEVSRLAGSIIERYQMQVSSSTDKLTGTLTRKSLEDALTEHIDRADELNGFFSIIMLDMDLFKQINDRFGHQAGDEALKRVCSIIRNNIRKDDVCGRYGGEEFIVILPETGSKGALSAAEKLRKEVEKAMVLGDKIPVTVSMGIASYPEHAQWKQELIEKADQALYVSKELGRNKCQLWSNEFSTKVKGTDKLTGIVSGNTVRDSRNVLVMLDIIELVKQNSKIEDKIFNLLGRVIEITESEYGMFFIIEDGKVKNGYARKIFEEDWMDMRSCNKEVIDSVIAKKQGIYMIDWDETPSYDSVTGMPEWNSISVSPLIKNGEVKGVLYLTVSTKKKEFKFEEYNFINTLGELAVAIL